MLELGRFGLHSQATRTDVAIATNYGLRVYGGTLRAWDRDKTNKIWQAVPVSLFGALTVDGEADHVVEVLGLVTGAGQIVKSGAGAVVLARTNTYSGGRFTRQFWQAVTRVVLARTNTYSGGTVLSNGTLAVKMRDALGTGLLRVAGGTLNFSLAGLYEEHLAGSFNQHTNPRSTVAMSVNAADIIHAFDGRSMAEQTTYGYQGFIVNPGPTNVVYTFAENFDDNVRLRIVIGGVTNNVLNNTSSNAPTLGTIELPPGVHRFDLRLGQAGGGAGGNPAQWWTRGDLGFGWDAEGRNAPIMEFYQPLRMPADGSLFIADTNGFLIPNGVRIDGNAAISLVGSRAAPMDILGALHVGSHVVQVTNNMAGALLIGGAVSISGTPTLAVSPGVTMVVTQGITGGAAGLNKDGLGLLKLRGASTFTGMTRVMAGVLELEGSGGLSSTTIQIDAGASLVATNVIGTFVVGTGRTLQGHGTFVGGLIIGGGGTLSPGTSAGQVSVIGTLGLADDSIFDVELFGLTPGTQYDQLLMNGPLTIGAALLNVSLFFTPALGSQFHIVTGLIGFDPLVHGTFAGLPDGAQFTVGSTLFEIDYQSTDITLTVVPEPATLGLGGMLALVVLRRRRLRR